MAGEIEIRALRPEDVARVKTITLEGFGPVSVEAEIERRWPGLLPTAWDERKWQSMQSEVRDHPEWCFVAETGGEVVGYVTTIIFERDQVGRIPDLAVDARFRGLGIGRQLLEHALDFFRRRGLHVARIETLAHNEVGQRLYPSLGFEEIARQVHYAMPLAPASEKEEPDDS